jgi:hypothetical protein
VNGVPRLRRVALAAIIAAGGGTMIVGLSRPASTGLTLSATAAAEASAAAVEVDHRLGLRMPASRNVVRLTDTASGQLVDEVTDLDPGGTPLGITRFDLSGQLVSSIRLGYLPAIGPSVTSGAAAQAATGILASVGIRAGGTPAVSARTSGGWLVRWVRIVDSVPVPGDGVGIQLAADGSFHALARTQHPLAATPSTTLDGTRARALAGARLDAWLSPDLRGLASVASIGLAWVAPNDTFGDPLPVGPTGTVRLAWLVRVGTTGALADRFAGLELAFDAGTGLPLGGDILE